MIGAERLRRAVDGLRQQFIALHGHEALLPPRKFSMSHINLFCLLIASPALPEAPFFRASLLATMCVLYVSGFHKAELVAYGTCRNVRRGSHGRRSCG
eukprot:600068-Pleurochrysis_carterae.AAC.1